MSSYSDWKVGAITDSEFKSAMRKECEESDEHGCWDCTYNDECDKEYCPIENGDWE